MRGGESEREGVRGRHDRERQKQGRGDGSCPGDERERQSETERGRETDSGREDRQRGSSHLFDPHKSSPSKKVNCPGDDNIRDIVGSATSKYTPASRKTRANCANLNRER